MAESVRRHAFGDACLIDVLTQNLPRPHSRQRVSPGVEKQDPLPFSPLDFRPELAGVDGNRTNRLATDWYDSLLAALAEHAHEPLVHQDVAHTHGDPLRDPEPGPISELEHCPVAKRQRLVKRWRRDQTLYFLHSQHFGKGAPL